MLTSSSVCQLRLISPDTELSSNTLQDLQNVSHTNISLAEPDMSDLAGKSYSLGVIFGLIGATSRAAHYVTCKIIFEKKSTSTNWIILFAGLGGFLVSVMSSLMDSDHQLLSARITEISADNWTGQSLVSSLLSLVSSL